MPDPTPRKVNKADYLWCEGCNGYVLKKHVKASSDDDFFGEEKPKTICPAGHELALEAPAGA